MRRITLAIAASLATIGCHRAQLVTGGCTPSYDPDSTQKASHRRAASTDAGRATFVAHMESAHVRPLTDASIGLRDVMHPDAVVMLRADTLHVGSYVRESLEPAVYVVLARRVGYRPLRDTVRLEAGQIDSATYRTFAEPVCLNF